jgi:hypothetical protein
MDPEKERPIGKISYEKPTAVDLGPTAPVVGASCVDGARIINGGCVGTGNAADVACLDGNGR